MDEDKRRRQKRWRGRAQRVLCGCHTDGRCPRVSLSSPPFLFFPSHRPPSPCSSSTTTYPPTTTTTIIDDDFILLFPATPPDTNPTSFLTLSLLQSSQIFSLLFPPSRPLEQSSRRELTGKWSQSPHRPLSRTPSSCCKKAQWNIDNLLLACCLSCSSHLFLCLFHVCSRPSPLLRLFFCIGLTPTFYSHIALHSTSITRGQRAFPLQHPTSARHSLRQSNSTRTRAYLSAPHRHAHA